MTHLSRLHEHLPHTCVNAFICRKTLGKKMATFLSLLMAAYMWGACNAYLVSQRRRNCCILLVLGVEGLLQSCLKQH